MAARGYALARRGHSRDVERIGRFLQVLEKRSQRRFRVDVALVPPAALGARDVPRIDDEAYDAILKCGAAEVVTIGGLLRDGDTRVFWSGGVRQQVVDLEVTQTGVIPILGPVVASRPHGFFARTTLSLSPDAGYGRLDIHVSRASGNPQPEQRSIVGTHVDLVEPQGTSHGSFRIRGEDSTSVRLHDGAFYVAGDAAYAQRVRDALLRFVHDRIRLADIEVWQVSLERGAQAKVGSAGTKLSPCWRENDALEIENYCRVVGNAWQQLAVS